MSRNIIIGLDGVPYDMIKDLAETGVMSNTKIIIDEGFLYPMQSSIPAISSTAWSSIITGKNPGEHGIFGFTDIPLGTYRLSFPNFNNLQSRPFWSYTKYGKSVIINVPSTYPVKEMDGIHISGFISLDMKYAVWPTSLIPKLEEMKYKIDVDVNTAHNSLDLFISNLNKTLEARIDLLWTLFPGNSWRNFMIVFTGTDRLMHFLWDAYKDNNHKYHNEFLSHFRKIDNEIGLVHASLKANDNLILLSDHGFEGLDTEVNINYILKDTGFLSVGSNGRNNYAGIDYDTVAFALDPARIYINEKDKYPRGSVLKKDRVAILVNIAMMFSNLTYKGRKIVKNIYHKENIYKGKCRDNAPDLVLIPHKGFNFRASMNAESPFGKDIFTGKHNEYAFLLTNRKVDSAQITVETVWNHLR